MKLWKKVLAATAASACCLSFAQVSGFQNLLQTAEPVLSASAASGTYEDLTYSVNSSGEITITDCDKTVTVACHAKRKKLTRKTKKTLLNTTFKSVFYYL